jgi:hypothetical protein
VRGGPARGSASELVHGRVMTRLSLRRSARAPSAGPERRSVTALRPTRHDYFTGFGNVFTASSPTFLPISVPTTVELR